MSNQIGIYGDITFQAFTSPIALSYSDQFTWNQRSRLKGKPVLESSSDELREYRLSFDVHQDQELDPDSYLAKWQTAAVRKKPYSLTLAEVYIGEYVITKIQVNARKLADDGRSISLSFEVEILESVAIDPVTQPSRATGFSRKSVQTSG